MSQPPKREEFKAILTALAGKKDIPDIDFAESVYTAISHFGLAEEIFRDTFGLTEGAVFRWTQGKNMPHQIVRAKILLWLRERL